MQAKNGEGSRSTSRIRAPTRWTTVYLSPNEGKVQAFSAVCPNIGIIREKGKGQDSIRRATILSHSVASLRLPGKSPSRYIPEISLRLLAIIVSCKRGRKSPESRDTRWKLPIQTILSPSTRVSPWPDIRAGLSRFNFTLSFVMQS